MKTESSITNILKKNKGAYWPILDQSIVSGVNFLTSILLARFLGLESFGVFSLIWLVLIFCQSISNALISIPFLTLSQKRDIGSDQENYVACVFVFQIILALILFLSVMLAGWWLEKFNPESHFVGLGIPLALAISFKMVHDFLRRCYFIKQEFKSVFFNDCIAYGGYALSLIILGLMNKLDVGFVFYLNALWLGAGSLVVCYEMRFDLQSRQVLSETIREHWVFGRWLVAQSIVQWMGKNYLIVAAGALLGVAAVGALKAAQSIVGISHILFLALENIMPVRAAKKYQQSGLAGLKSYIWYSFKLGGGQTLLLMFPVVVWPEFFLELFGDEYLEYSTLLRLYALHYLIVFIGLPMRITLRTLEDTRTIFFSYLIMASVSAVGGHLIVSKLGINGVVFGLMLLQLIMYGCYLKVLVPRFRSDGITTGSRKGL